MTDTTTDNTTEMICTTCRTIGSAEAKRCAACGAWFVPTRLSDASSALRVIGWIWLVVSLVGALATWLNLPHGDATGAYGQPIETHSLLTGWIGISFAFAMALQGLLVGVGAIVIAERGPRLPRTEGV